MPQMATLVDEEYAEMMLARDVDLLEEMTPDRSNVLCGGAPSPERASPLHPRNGQPKSKGDEHDSGRQQPDRSHAEAPHVLLQHSPYAEDEGQLIGRDPRKVPPADWRAAGVDPSGVMRAIRAKCLDCVCYQPGEVRKCVAVTCPLWPFRMGLDVFHGKRPPSGKTRG